MGIDVYNGLTIVTVGMKMRVSFDQLKNMMVFGQVVRHGGFSSAARQLGLSRAVVSYHVKRLEKELNVKLLNRTTRSISLTDVGKQYYESCKFIADEAETASLNIENLRDKPEGKLAITCSVNLGLQVIVPIMARFRRLYPGIVLDLNLSDGVVDIVKEGIDLAIRAAPLIDSGLKSARLSTLQTVLCASPSYLKTYGRPLSPDDLSDHVWVCYSPTSSRLLLNKKDHKGKSKHLYTIEMKGPVSTNNASARTAFVESGEGIGKVPYYDAHEKLQRGTLEQILPEYEVAAIELYGVFSPGATSSKKVRLALDYLKNSFQQLDKV